MLGLPTETEEDMRAIPELANEIAALYYDTVPKEQRNGKCQITISTSFFVPKPFTPFQWAPQCTKEQFLEKAYLTRSSIMSQLNQKSIKYNWHEPDVTTLEGFLARGDRRVGAAIEEAYTAAVSKVDKAVTKGVIHKNAANRKKAQLAKKHDAK